MRTTWIAPALGLLFLAAPAAGAYHKPPGTPTPFANDQANALGTIDMPPYVAAQGSSDATIDGGIHLRDRATVDKAQFLLIALNIKTSTTRIEFLGLETKNGTDVPLSRDERNLDPMQPRVMVAPKNLSWTGGAADLVLRARAGGTENGQFHVGALLVALGQDWTTLNTSDGNPAEIYSFTIFSVDGWPRSGAPFEGMGNHAAAILIGLIVLAAPVSIIVLTRGGAKPPA